MANKVKNSPCYQIKYFDGNGISRRVYFRKVTDGDKLRSLYPKASVTFGYLTSSLEFIPL